MKRIVMLTLGLVLLGCEPPPDAEDTGSPLTVDANYIPPEPKDDQVCRDGQWACYRSCIRDTGEGIWLPACLLLCDYHFNVCIGTPGMFK